MTPEYRRRGYTDTIFGFVIQPCLQRVRTCCIDSTDNKKTWSGW